MAGERRLKRRIKSAQNISKITKAMQMVSASRMKKAQEAAISGKPYQEKIYQTVSELSKGIDRSLHPLLKKEEKTTGKILNILISTNKGLCGGLNTNLFRALNRWFPEKKETDYLTIGIKGEGFIVRSGRTLTADFSADNFLAQVDAVSDFFIENFLNGKYREVNLIYNEFINSLRQVPFLIKILPIEKIESDEEKKQHMEANFLIEPSESIVLDALLPHYLEIQLRNAILEAVASEHSARMIAMKNATDNATSLISDLTLEYNQLRQQRITYEIADIVTAQIGIQS